MTEIFDILAEKKVVPIYNDGIFPDHRDDICEVTMRHSKSKEIIQECKDNGMIVGAGTVLHLNDYYKAKEAGADFFITPITSRIVIEEAIGDGMPFIPGACTANEIWKAIQLVDVVKIFPAKDIGTVIAPFLHLQKRFIATGSVNPDNYLEYLEIDGVMSVTGSSFAYEMHKIKKEMIQKRLIKE